MGRAPVLALVDSAADGDEADGAATEAAGGDSADESDGSGLAVTALVVGGVLLFAGLTAYDTQRIKEMYAHVAGTDMMGKAVIMGAL